MQSRGNEGAMQQLPHNYRVVIRGWELGLEQGLYLAPGIGNGLELNPRRFWGLTRTYRE